MVFLVITLKKLKLGVKTLKATKEIIKLLDAPAVGPEAQIIMESFFGPPENLQRLREELESRDALSRSTETDLGSDASLRMARTTTKAGGHADFSAFNVNGNRFMLSAGHDFKLVTPFVQTLYKTLGNTGYYTTYAGVELDVLNHSTSEYTTSLNVKVKGGVNQRNAVGKLSAHGNLNLNNGTNFSVKQQL